MDMLMQTANQSTVGDLRTLVREILDFLAGSNHTLDVTVQSLWQQYCDACRQVNLRLDRASQLLDRGEWLEAVRCVELEPRVLESVSILNFEFRETWEQLCAETGWTRLIPISLSVCERLSDAITNYTRLQPLLKTYLRLAISRAPVSDRLPVMRELARKDVLSTFWRDDVLALERLRIPELAKHLKKALADGNITDLQELLEEARSTPWIVRLPKSTRRLINTAEEFVLRSQSLPELGLRLVQQFRIQDAKAGIRTLDEWQTACQRLQKLVGAECAEPADDDPERRSGTGMSCPPGHDRALNEALLWAMNAARGQDTQDQLRTLAGRIQHAARNQQADVVDQLYAQSRQLASSVPARERDGLVFKTIENARRISSRRQWVVTAFWLAAGLGIFATLVLMLFLISRLVD